jgi:hypothetical protein
MNQLIRLANGSELNAGQRREIGEELSTLLDGQDLTLGISELGDEQKTLRLLNSNPRRVIHAAYVSAAVLARASLDDFVQPPAEQRELIKTTFVPESAEIGGIDAEVRALSKRLLKEDRETHLEVIVPEGEAAGILARRFTGKPVTFRTWTEIRALSDPLSTPRGPAAQLKILIAQGAALSPAMLSGIESMKAELGHRLQIALLITGLSAAIPLKLEQLFDLKEFERIASQA